MVSYTTSHSPDTVTLRQSKVVTPQHNSHLHIKKRMLKATILLGTLKPSSGKEFSNTKVLCEILRDELTKQNVATDIVRLVDYKILPGLKSNMGRGDEWPKILKRLIASDIIIFATPIWWGGHSSLIQRVFERMDELNDEIVATGKSELLNKVGGMVITGAEDGAQHVIAGLANFMIWNGLTLPPACSLSYLGGHKATTAQGLKKEFLKRSYTVGMAKTMARNLAYFAALLKENPLPVQEKDSQAFR
ncbi:MAG: flavodoxin family protein [Candidatus Roizmanbacteria bacterium]|nr:flavodoxin family protein [Candidatus Roizmanbacteria bacterium]